MAKSTGTLRIKWVVSDIACTRDMRQTIRGLGLRKLNQTVEREDTPTAYQAPASFFSNAPPLWPTVTST